MKKILFLISSIVLFTSCSKEDIPEPIVIKKDSAIVVPPAASPSFQSKTIGDTTYILKIIPTKYILYKESVKNQRSGIFFQWQENYGVNQQYLPQTDEMPKAWFGGGQNYGDVNNDGFIDFVVAVHTSATDVELKWFINDGDNYHFKKNTSMFNQSTKGLNAHKIVKTDVNNDAIADYITFGVDERIPGDYNGNFSVLIGKSNGTFDVNTIPNPTKYWFHNGAVGDLNKDGFVDVISATFIWLGDGNGNFTKVSNLNDYCQSILVYEILDMNGDGLNDIILSGPNDVTTIVYNNNGIFNNSNRVLKLEKVQYKIIQDIELYDIDSDGDYDIIENRQMETEPNSKLFVHLNNGNAFNYVSDYIQNSNDGAWLNGDKNAGPGYQDKFGWDTFKFDDIDGDGIDDIIPENYHDGKFNGLKKINGVWKPHIFSFQKCKK
jgi:hypothetical protein